MVQDKKNTPRETFGSFKKKSHEGLKCLTEKIFYGVYKKFFLITVLLLLVSMIKKA